MCLTASCLRLLQKKVRDVKFCRETARVATVSADGTLMVLDAQLSLIRTVSRESRAMCAKSHFTTEGSRDFSCAWKPTYGSVAPRIMSKRNPVSARTSGLR